MEDDDMHTLAPYENYRKFSQEVSEGMKGKLKEVADIDMVEIMASIENLLKVDYKIHHSDLYNIMIKVDRRKNILTIISDIEKEVKLLVGEDMYDLIFKIRVSVGMVSIKRRR